jgi:aminodeoxyfutalosine deaminase
MDDYLSQLPKAELHLHLEGSVDPETLCELDDSATGEEVRQLYEYDGFAGFLRSFGAVVKRLKEPADYGLVTRRLLERLAAQNVRYAEITLSAGVVLWKGQEFAPVFDAVREAARGSAVEVWWILDAVRQFGVEPAMEVARLAAERAGDGVVAYGIGGNEERGPAEWFTDVFAFAKSAGLRLTAHAGESMGPESVWAALRLGAERIGHGIAAAQDEALLRHLRERDVPLEVCITSNLATGVVPRIEDHPVRRLYDAGVPIVLNSDDPGMFRCTLTDEYRLAARQFGFSEAEMRGLADNGFRYAFRGPRAKRP